MMDPTARVADAAALRGAPQGGDAGGDDAQQQPFETWSRERAEAWRRSHPTPSPWWVVTVQLAAGLACCGVVAAVAQDAKALWSALYGVAAVVVPSALLARGMTKPLVAVRGAAGLAVLRLMVWEGVKIGAAIAMLVAAPRVIDGLVWPALLASLIVCIKTNWLALLWRPRAALVQG